MINDKIVIGGEITLVQQVDGVISLDLANDGSPGLFMPIVPNVYTGSIEVEPSAEAQTLVTHGLTVMQDIVIDPIPVNYGLVEWDGRKLRIS